MWVMHRMLMTVRANWDGRDVAATAVVLVLVAALYLYFSFRVG